MLVLAHRPDLTQHNVALGWLQSALAGEEPVVVCDVILASTYRILSNPKLTNEASAAERAMTFLDEIRALSVVISPADRYWTIFRALVTESRAVGNLVTDAGIAAMAIEQGCSLATFDHDFARFPGLNWFEPVHRSQ